MEPHLPLWALYVQAFGTILAAVVAAIIASAIQYRQWRLAKDKLRLDLFERRAQVYSALFSEIMVVDGDERRQRRIIDEALDQMRAYRLLFDARIVDKIEQARTTLMLISAECNKQTLSHDRIMNYFRAFNNERDALDTEMTALLRFD